MFSVIVPVYNADKYLENCIESILNQSFMDFELILVDDGSTDESSIICDEFENKEKRIIVYHKENGGANSARNLGILNAHGEYICLFDADDYIMPSLLESVNEEITRAPSRPDIVLYNYRIAHDDSVEDRICDLSPGYYDRARMTKEVFPQLIDKSSGKGFEPLFSHAPWNKVYKKTLLEKHICEDPTIRVANDCAFTYECVLYAQSMVVCSQVLYQYQSDTRNSLQRTYHPDMYVNYTHLFKYLNERISNLHPLIAMQLNSFYYYHLRKIMIDELCHFDSISKAAKNLKCGLKETNMLQYISPRQLPFIKRMRLYLLKGHFYWIALALQRLRNNRCER